MESGVVQYVLVCIILFFFIMVFIMNNAGDGGNTVSKHLVTQWELKHCVSLQIVLIVIVESKMLSFISDWCFRLERVYQRKETRQKKTIMIHTAVFVRMVAM